MNTVQYSLNENVMMQRDIRIPENKSVFQAIIDKDFKLDAPEDVVIMLSVSGNMAELNITGSIVLESLLEGLSKKVISNRVKFLFHPSKANDVGTDVTNCISSLLESNIIKQL